MDNETENRLIENQLIANAGNKLRDAAKSGDALRIKGVFWTANAILSDLMGNPNIPRSAWPELFEARHNLELAEREISERGAAS